MFNSFFLSYDTRLRTATWLMEHLTPEELQDRDSTNRDKLKFHEDEGINKYFRASNNNYLHSTIEAILLQPPIIKIVNRISRINSLF